MTAKENSARRAVHNLACTACLVVATLVGSTPALAQAVPSKSPPTNSDSLVISDYEKRLQDYVKLRKHESAGIPPLKTTDSSERIKERQLLLANKIKAERSQAKKGEIFTPDTCQLFKNLIAQAYRQSDPAKVKASLRHSEPVKDIPVYVNESYPEKVPLQTTPASILGNLPPLPRDLEYRIVGQSLVLRDMEANIVVDFIPGALPSS
jgi:hypothetical protein